MIKKTSQKKVFEGNPNIQSLATKEFMSIQFRKNRRKIARDKKARKVMNITKNLISKRCKNIDAAHKKSRTGKQKMIFECRLTMKRSQAHGILVPWIAMKAPDATRLTPKQNTISQTKKAKSHMRYFHMRFEFTRMI